MIRGISVTHHIPLLPDKEKAPRDVGCTGITMPVLSDGVFAGDGYLSVYVCQVPGRENVF